jgi:DNA-binding NarL/FixJ family response regulator
LLTDVRRVNDDLPQVLLLDLRMANGSSIEMIRRLRARVPNAQIVVMATEESPVFARRALDAGAAAYVLTDAAGSELPGAIRLASCDEGYVSPRVAAALNGLQIGMVSAGVKLTSCA